MRAVASSPSISGMWTSMSTRSNGGASNASGMPSLAKASRPSFATTTAWPSFSSARTASVWLTALSSASSTRRAAPGSCGRTWAAGRGAGPAGPAARAVKMASSRSDCLTGLAR